MQKTKLMLIDGNSLLFRAFYALPLLHNREGIYTNGVYGFLTMFNRVVAEEKPTHIVVAFDKSRETFRTVLYQDYKAHRSAPPEELIGQFQLIRDVLEVMNVSFIELQGYEADDLIGTLSTRASKEGTDCVILTGDGDSLQLVSDRIHVMMTKKGITQIAHYDPQQVREKWEVDPEQLVEIKGLMGDTSDNIPGVPGIGPKTAIKLVKEYQSLENLYQNLDHLKGKQAELLAQYQDQAFISRELGTIVRDIELDVDIEDFRVKSPDLPKLLEMYQNLEFGSLIKALQAKAVQPGEETIPVPEYIDVEMVASQEQWQIVQNGLTMNTAILLKGDYHHPMWAKPEAIFFCGGERVYGIDIISETQQKLAWLKDYLESALYPKVFHNAKYAQVLLRRFGIHLQGVVLDTLLLAYVKDPAFDGDDLSATIFKYLNINIPKDQTSQLAARIIDLARCLEEGLPETSRALYFDVEHPLSPVLASMEYSGIQVDGQRLEGISAELAAGIDQSEARIFALAGGQFNINSPRQLGKVLFEDLGLTGLKKTKSGFSTDAEVLEQLAEQHEIIGYILNYRQLTKLKSTYVDALRNLIHPDTGRVHTIFKQAQTATGRLSSVEPNLQNIPIRMEEGRRIRMAFTARDENHVILAADYSQIDLRSLAHISEDPTLIDTFKKGIDIHTRTASEIFHVPLDEVTGEMRRRAKAINFGIIYGMGDFRLARDTGVSRSEARLYIDHYLNTYPMVQRYMEDIVIIGRECGYVETVLKRRRYIPDLRAKNKVVQANARRIALNTPIQGTSADIIKLAMIQVFSKLAERGLEQCLLLQVHDELVLEVQVDRVQEIGRLLKDCMENAYQLLVPLVVSVKQGPNWHDMQPVRIDA